MKTSFKKIAAFLTAAAIVTTLSGCSDNGYIMTVDDMPIRTGVYISFQQTSMNNARDRLSEIIGDLSDTEELDVFSQSMDGKSFSDWVKDDTKKGIKRFVGVQRQCEQFGITLSDDEKSEISKSVQANWDLTEMNYYGYTYSVQDIYGYNSMGDYYTSQGIGIDSLKEISYANALNDKLFMHYYGEGGEKAVPTEEIDEYLEENSVAYKLITMGYTDFRGDPVVGDEQQEIIDLAESYAELYNNKKSFIDVLYEFDLYTAQNKAKKEAEEEFEANPPEGVTYDEYIAEAVKKATATKGESDDKYDEIVFNDNSYLTDELMDFILSAPADGTAAAYAGSTSVYIIIRNPVSNFPAWREQNLEDVLTTLRGDDYDSLMDLMSQNYDVVQKEDLVNKKYAPEKLNK